MSRILIAGNGPSLRDLDFGALGDMHWLGMNAAYRVWDKLGIYPTLYSCLDGVVVKSHAREILRLHQEGKIEKFFLTREILEEIPDFPRDGRVFFRDELATSDLPAASIFRSAYPSKLTTGSWAVRFAIFLGYRDIHLSGIDCNYVEVIPEAKATEVGLGLEITEKVASNPNYFFDDYQQPGDLYQVPNPESHGGNLHLQSFEALAADIAAQGLDVRVTNTARESQLARQGVFGHAPLSSTLGMPDLGAVAVPLTVGELDQVTSNLALWDRAPFHPLRPDSPLAGKIDLHLFFDCARSEPVVARLRSAWSKLRFLPGMFRRLEITFLAIPDDLNRYIRDPAVRNVPRKTGPNLHFLAMMEECRRYRYVQLLETDCIPAKADWLGDLDDLCGGPDRFWIAGGYLPNVGNAIAPWLGLHINGNALYASGDPGFREFLQDTFVPALRYLVHDRREFSLAYDCLIARLKHYGLNGSTGGTPALSPRDPELDRFYRSVQANLERFRVMGFIRNISHMDGEYTDAQLLAMLESDCVLVHSRRLSTLVASEAERAEATVGPVSGDGILRRRLADTHIRVPRGGMPLAQVYSNLESLSVDHFDPSAGTVLLDIGEASFRNTEPQRAAYLVHHAFGSVAGKELRCDVTLVAEHDMVVDLKFSRQGAGPYVEASGTVEVPAGVVARHALAVTCRTDYSKFRLTIKPRSGVMGKLKAQVRVAVDGPWRRVPVVNDASGRHSGLFKRFRMAPRAPRRQAGVAALPKPSPAVATLPRVLIVDAIPTGRPGSATGQLKQALFQAWDAGSLLQVWEDPGDAGHPLKVFSPPGSWEASRKEKLTAAMVMARCRAFRPDAIYLRPTESLALLRMAEELEEALGIPLAIHMMDDWPERLRREDPAAHLQVAPVLRRLVSRASARLSICRKMSQAYGRRYGGDWLPVANGVDPDLVASFRDRAAPEREPGAPFLIRYMGGLAADMNFQAVLDVARVVHDLNPEVAVRLEIYTMPWYIEGIRDAAAGLAGVEVRELVSNEEYLETLMDADALLLAYNFDPATIAYTRYSMANKMPECLAAGVPVLAYGPSEIATIDYLDAVEGALTVVRRDERLLADTIRSLVADPDRARRVAERGRAHALNHLRLDSMRSALLEALGKPAPPRAPATSEVLPAPFRPSEFQRANALFRAGEYAQALVIYRALADGSAWPGYTANAELCLSRLRRQDELAAPPGSGLPGDTASHA